MSEKRRNTIVILSLLAALGSMPAAAQNAAPLSIVPPAMAEAAKKDSAPQAAVAKPMVMRTGAHETYDRFVFDWPGHVDYKITRQGSRAEIHFAAPGTVQLKQASYLSRGKNFVASKDANGNLVVSFDLDPKAEIKDFYSGNSTAFDIVGAEPAVAATPAPVPVKKPQPVVQQPPAAPDAKPVAAVEAQPLPAETSKEQPATTPPAAVAASTPAPPSAPTPEISLPPSTALPVPVATASPPPSFLKPGRDIPDIHVGADPVLIATLDPKTPLRAAVWSRAGYGYIVFDKKLSLTPEALGAGYPAALVKLQTLDIAKDSGFRFPVPDGVQIHITHEGSAWKLFLTTQQPDVPVSTSLIAQPDFALGARLLLPLPDAPEPVNLNDPVVGDDLIIVPLTDQDAFSIGRRMADFDIIPSAQGLVLRPANDKLIVRNVLDGIEITAENGLRLSSAIDTGNSQQSEQNAKSMSSGKSIFDFNVWRGKEGESFTQARQRLQQTIVDVPERERNRARLELARFYFARGFGAEAMGLLNYLAKLVPDLAAHSDYLALSGAAKILANRPEDGIKDLQASGLDLPEIKLWEAVGAAKLGSWVDAEDKFAASENILAGYPEPFYSHFFVLAIEAALAVGNDHEAADWLNTLQASPHNERVDPAIDYLHGVLHAKAGQASAAAESWKLAAGSNDRLYKVRAEMALIDLDVANGSLSPAQAADRLEALRFAWRGDDLEVDILHRLGLFYIKAKNVKAGFGALAQAVRLYPNSPLAPKIHEEMTQTFHDVFLGDLGKGLTPLEALSIYQQYRDGLIPDGPDGIAVIRSLAERLVAIDLMDQAGDLLVEVAQKLKGEEKGQVTTRLAAIRLIDHKPQQALDALELSAGDTLPDAMQKERLLLRARALSQMGKADDALALLKDNQDYPSKLLRADINLEGKHWAEASKNLLDLVGPPPPAGTVLKDQQAEWLLRSAVALAMAGDQVGLDRLAIDYGAAMTGTPQNDTFRILVEPEKLGSPKDIAAAQAKLSEVDIFQGFLDNYRKAGDIETPKAAAKPAAATP